MDKHLPFVVFFSGFRFLKKLRLSGLLVSLLLAEVGPTGRCKQMRKTSRARSDEAHYPPNDRRDISIRRAPLSASQEHVVDARWNRAPKGVHCIARTLLTVAHFIMHRLALLETVMRNRVSQGARRIARHVAGSDQLVQSAGTRAAVRSNSGWSAADSAGRVWVCVREVLGKWEGDEGCL